MKKIIATVLAMVMALALCTVAFADTTATVGEVRVARNGKVVGDALEDITAEYTKASKIVYDTDGTVKTNGNVPYYTIGGTDYIVATDAKDANYAVYTAKGWVFVVPAVGVEYEVEATLVGKLDKKCVSLGSAEEGKYYSFKDSDGDVQYFVAIDEDDVTDESTFALVDGTTLVAFDTYTDTLTMNHTWKVATYADDNITIETYQCKVCKAVGKVVSYAEYLAADEDSVCIYNGDYLVVGATGTKADDAATTSPKTFDAGIAMYVGMALTSVAGSAVVIGKKKEF